jgi:hypothetical protein
MKQLGHLDILELSLNKEKANVSKIQKQVTLLMKQRKHLKNEAKVVSLSEFRKIVKEIVATKTLLEQAQKRALELEIQHEKEQAHQDQS